MTPESELAKKITLGLRLGQALGPDYDGSSLAEACEALLAALDAERAQVLEDREEVSALQTKLAEARSALQACQQETEALKQDQADWRKGVALIASYLGDPAKNLSCVRIAELGLQIRVQYEEAWSALHVLVDRLTLIHDDPAYQSVWQIAQLHVGQYSGPKYDKEFEAAQAVLAGPSPARPQEEKSTR